MGRVPLQALVAFTFIYTIVLLQSCHGYGQAVKVDDDGEQAAVLRLVTGGGGGRRRPSPKAKASMMIYLFPEELQVGNSFPLLLPRLKRAPNFISSEKADSIPFSTKEFQQILQYFSIPPGSETAEIMWKTLRRKEAPPMRGETKFCPTSKDSMFHFVRSTFSGLSPGGGDFQVLGTTTTSHNGRHQQHLQKYNVLGLTEYKVAGPSAVGCHTMPYPYAVYYCHHLIGGNKAFMAQLEGEEDGERVDAAVLCHLNSSTWSPDHESFLVLGIKPGPPICHVFAYYDLIFIPAPTIAMADPE